MSGKVLYSTLLSAAIGLAVMAPPAVQAQGQPPAQGHDPAAIYVEAGATPDQLTKIRELGQQFEELAKVKWQLMMNLQKQMHELALQTDPDEKAVMAKQEEINKVNGEMGTEKIKMMLKIRTLLNTEQKQKLVQLIQQRQQAHRGGGMLGGPGGGPSGPPGGP